MPFVSVKVIEGVFSAEQKKALIEKVTDAFVAVEGERLRPYVSVVLEEVRSGEWAIGGKPLTTDDVREIVER